MEPLRWSMHGGPGTGRQISLNRLKLDCLQKFSQYNIAEDFGVVALQAAMADLLGSDTVHHALNLHVYGKHNQNT